MYREHAGPPPPNPFEAADKNARDCGYVQLGTVGMTALSVSLVALQMSTSPTWAFIDAEARGTVIAYAFSYVLVSLVWAALNAWGLRRRVRVAQWSSYLFAVSQIITCFGLVFGAGLLFLLTKKEMKGYYDDRIAG